MSGVFDQDAVGKANVSGAATTVDVTSGPTRTLRGVRDEAEIQIIIHTLHRTGWNRKRAAALLEISYRGLLYKISRHGLTRTAPGAGRP
jgi:DNA-binding NtrC family response regulator